MVCDDDATVDFHLFYDGAADMQIWILLTRSQCRVSHTQVTVKALGHLVSYTHSVILASSRQFVHKVGGLYQNCNENFITTSLGAVGFRGCCLNAYILVNMFKNYRVMFMLP